MIRSGQIDLSQFGIDSSRCKSRPSLFIFPSKHELLTKSGHLLSSLQLLRDLGCVTAVTIKLIDVSPLVAMTYFYDFLVLTHVNLKFSIESDLNICCIEIVLSSRLCSKLIA